MLAGHQRLRPGRLFHSATRHAGLGALRIPVGRHSGGSRAPTSRLFKADPVRYAPQFANFCAVALARGEVREANPEYWLISDGQLYLFGKSIGPEVFRKDLAGSIERANQQSRAACRDSAGRPIEPRLLEPSRSSARSRGFPELVAKIGAFECRIGAAQVLDRACRFFGLPPGMRRGQHHVVEARIRVALQVELGLLDGFRVPVLEVIRHAQREPVEGIELRIDALSEFQRVDGGVRVPQPHQDIAATGQRIGVTGVDWMARSISTCASVNWLYAMYLRPSRIRARVSEASSRSASLASPTTLFQYASGDSAHPIDTAT